MRYLDRKAVECPPSLAPGGAADQEREAASVHYGVAGVAAFKFKAYKNADVVAALTTLFNKKCAYCESRFVAVQPMDVEHFRPKLAVEGDSDHPGYWWLAASWSNLLPACIDCNRRRYNDLYSADEDAERSRALAGKKDLFPILGAARARKPDDALDNEEPLLIDPTVRDPQAHLGWNTVNKDGRALSVAVANVRELTEDPHGKTSIDVFGLNRPGLVDERTTLLERLECDYLKLRKFMLTGLKMDPSNLPEHLAEVRNWISDLQGEGARDKPYSACAGEFVRARITAMMMELEAFEKKCAP